jgi:hypothetical protein
MVCGLKWKSCDCPWFSYEAIDTHLGIPLWQQQELDRRRDQMQRDETLARRMQQMNVRDDGHAQPNGFGLGNAADHYMNQNFIRQAREALTANYAHAEQAARGLLNGFVMGRENPLPGLPGEMQDMLDVIHGQQTERPARRTTTRRRNVVAENNGEYRGARDQDQERRIQEWANSVPA